MKNLYVLGLSLSFCLLFIRKGNAQVLGYAQGDFVEIDSKQGITGNTFIRKLWLYRDTPGNNWWSTSLYDGIGIDISFLNPGVDTKTWWKRDPYNEIQSWGTGHQTYLTLSQGRLGIGTTTPKEKLSVDGNIGAREIQVRSDGWPDYVFKPEYALPSLADIEKQIKQNGHLPEMPSAAEVEINGIALGEMNKLLLKKVEELTLHLIEKDKAISEQSTSLAEQKQKIAMLEKDYSELHKEVQLLIQKLK